jgi:small subunit ribosomal protein S2
MEVSSLKNLLEAGVHFGHQTRRWNPKMRRFIFGERNGIYIIDLQKTLRQLAKGSDLVRDSIADGGKVLFVGTKRQIKEVVREEAERCDMYFVTNRWLGGMLTNYQTIRKNIRRLRDLEQKRDEGAFELFTKKEVQRFKREITKLETLLGGIKEMDGLPSVLFIVDAKKERIAVNEANKLGIPIVAIVDTNSDPDPITIPIAGNDDAIRSVRLITSRIADAVVEGRGLLQARQAEAMAQKREEEAEKKAREERAGAEEEAEDDVDVEKASRKVIKMAKKVKQSRKSRKSEDEGNEAEAKRQRTRRRREGAPPEAESGKAEGDREEPAGSGDEDAGSPVAAAEPEVEQAPGGTEGTAGEQAEGDDEERKE